MTLLNRIVNRKRERFGELENLQFSFGLFELETSVGHVKVSP